MRIIGILFSILILVGCSNLREEPNDLIGQTEMVNILVDYYMYQNFNVIKTEGYTSKDIPKINLAITKKHNVNFNQFQQSLDYYILQDRDTYKDILEDVEGRLNNLAPTLVEDTLSTNKPLKITQEKPKVKPKTSPTKPKISTKKLPKDSIQITLDEKGEINQLKKTETLNVKPKAIKIDTTQNILKSPE